MVNKYASEFKSWRKVGNQFIQLQYRCFSFQFVLFDIEKTSSNILRIGFFT